MDFVTILKAWARGASLTLTVWFAHLIVCLPLVLIQFLFPNAIKSLGLTLFFLLAVVILYPFMFYVCAYTFGVRLKAWDKEDQVQY